MTEKPFFSENENKKGLYDEGSVLDGRYKLSRIIGEGGFGITYEAININSGKHVAIKAQKEGNKERFLREARLLRDFADEPNIVTVLDCFEEEDTAFIVMEYLDGIPLSEEILKNGKWSAEKTVRSFFPVMKALEHIHSCGMIHRDISPDNLMLMKDGSLILIDFGAAKDIQENNFTRSAVFKSIYSPPEQRDSGITLGSYTDVYALCATIYFCITGIEPEDSLSRLLFDELKKPSELDSDIKPGSESALMNGLELDCAARTQEIEELRNALEKDYPDLTLEEIETRKKYEQQRKRTILILCATALCCILGFLYVFRIRILFSMIETQSVWLDGSNMSETVYKNNSDKVLERVKAFAGDRFLWNEEAGQYIRLTVPSELFQKSDPFNYVRYMLTRPINISAQIPDDSGNIQDLGIISKSEDIESVQIAGNNISITFMENSSERFGNKLDRAGEIIYITYDAEHNPDSFTDTYITTGDGKSISRTADDPKDEYPVPNRLKLLQLTQQPLSAPFPVHTDWKIRWEDTNSALFPGKNQMNQGEIPGTTISIKYKPQFSDKQKIDGYDLVRTGYPAVIKNRLDSLDSPYAFGIDPYDEDTVVVKIPADRYWPEEYDWIGKLSNYDFSYGSRKVQTPNIKPSGIFFQDNGDETWQLETTLSDWNKNDSIKSLHVLQQQGEQDWCLYFGDVPLFSCTVEDAIQTLQESGTIIFDRSLMTAYPKMDETTKHFGRFISTSLAQNLRDGYYDCIPGIELRDDKGNTIHDPIDTGLFPPPFVSAPQIAELVNKWQDEYKEILVFDYFNEIKNNTLRIKVINTDISDPEKNLNAIEPFFCEYGDALNSGFFASTAVYFLPGEKIENQFVRLNFQTDFETGKLGIKFDEWLNFHTNGIPEEIAAHLEEKFENYMKTNDFWAQFVH